MNIIPMFEVNKKINSSIKINPNLNAYKLRVHKLLEFEISLGELANETKCYDYSSSDISTDSDLILEKYLNCLSKLITLGIDYNYNDIDNINFLDNETCLSDQFLTLYIDINDLIVSPCKDHYTTLFEDLLTVGNCLGFSEDFINEKFMLKFS